MGRTTTAPVDNTSSDGVTHIGTNVNAKYAVHFHHVGMACPSARTFSDNVVQGIGTGKWGVDVHGTYDTILADNVVLDFPGAGFITEDGYEVRNHFSRNLAMYNLNTTGVTSATDDIRTNQPGTEGTGFWLHGIMQYLDGNQVWDNTVGINLLAVFMTVPGSYPSSPGVMPDIPLGPFDSPSFQPFLSLTGNTVVGSGVIGFEAWGVKRAPADQNIFANNYVGFLSAQADNDPWFRTNNLFVNTNIPLNGSVPLDQLYNWGRCIQLASGYVAHFQMDSGYIGGCGIGIQGIPIDGFVVSNVTFKNPVDVNFDHGVPPGSVFSGDTFIVYGQYPPIFYLQYGTDVLWNGTGPNPLDGGPPPPPPPPPTWVTLSGIFQQQTTPDPTQFRLCPDATGMNCQAFVKP
jgi:hypothetical protein